jgi:predicted N-acetyltransferase YhbS
MEIRTLEPGEREALLELLDGWPLPDGAHGREFFRRYVEGDPTFADENVWVAAEGGALLSCVQIFPRPLRIAGAVVPVGGIGSVFTREDARRRGLAERLVARSCDAMRARGMPVSLLFGSQSLYARQGYEAWPARAALLLRVPGAEAPAGPPGVAVSAFDAPADLAAVRALHARYSELLPGTVARDDALWAHSLANGGNPDEEFLVARAGGELVAYARAALLSGVLNLTELGCAPGFEPALADLVARVASERADDPFAARAGRPSAELRRVLASAPVQSFAPDLAVALARAGFELRDLPLRHCMLRCLDAGGLGERVGARPRPGEGPNAFLARLLPGAELTFWAADRF